MGRSATAKKSLLCNRKPEIIQTIRTVTEIGLVLHVMFLKLPSDLRDACSSKGSQLF